MIKWMTNQWDKLITKTGWNLVDDRFLDNRFEIDDRWGGSLLRGQSSSGWKVWMLVFHGKHATESIDEQATKEQETEINRHAQFLSLREYVHNAHTQSMEEESDQSNHKSIQKSIKLCRGLIGGKRRRGRKQWGEKKSLAWKKRQRDHHKPRRWPMPPLPSPPQRCVYVLPNDSFVCWVGRLRVCGHRSASVDRWVDQLDEITQLLIFLLPSSRRRVVDDDVCVCVCVRKLIRRWKPKEEEENETEKWKKKKKNGAANPNRHTNENSWRWQQPWNWDGGVRTMHARAVARVFEFWSTDWTIKLIIFGMWVHTHTH